MLRYEINGYTFSIDSDGIFSVDRVKNLASPGFVEALVKAQEIYRSRVKPACVYLMDCPTPGVYKIGVLVDSERRKYDVCYALNVVHKLLLPTPKAAFRLERDLHVKFEAKRYRAVYQPNTPAPSGSEWFELSPEDVEWIKSIHSTNGNGHH